MSFTINLSANQNKYKMDVINGVLKITSLRYNEKQNDILIDIEFFVDEDGESIKSETELFKLNEISNENPIKIKFLEILTQLEIFLANKYSDMIVS